jgi:GR25 family glycosyltransferase involved in LPS biosynthesis
VAEVLGARLVPFFILGVRSNYRGNPLEAQLKNLGIDFKNIWGLEVSDFDAEFLESLMDNRKSKFLRGRSLTYGELSCSLGHLEMYEEFLLTGQNWGFFLEDDTTLNPSFDVHKLIKSLPDNLPPSIVSLANSSNEEFAPRPFPFLEKRLILADSIEFRQCGVAPVGAYAYLMNRRAAQVAVHELRSRRVYSAADFPFQFRNLVDFFVSRFDFMVTGTQPSLLDEARVALTQGESYKRWRNNLSRRLRVLLDYSGVGILTAKYLGLSGRAYVNENIRLRTEYKKFCKGKSSKFVR